MWRENMCTFDFDYQQREHQSLVTTHGLSLLDYQAAQVKVCKMSMAVTQIFRDFLAAISGLK